MPLDAITKLTAYCANVGIQGTTSHLFFAEVDDSMVVSDGGGLENDGEAIELVAWPLANIEAFTLDESVAKTSGAMYGLIMGKSMALAKSSPPS